MELIRIEDAHARLEISPGQGAQITRYDAFIAGASVPIFKPGTSEVSHGCQLLVPWSNRMSGGGFEFEGRFHPVEPNVPGVPFPSHGDGFQKRWRVVSTTATRAELALDDGSIGPYRYSARVVYALDNGALVASLHVENRAAFALPYGLGFHPWFLRTAGTQLRAPAERVWIVDERNLPTGVEHLASRSDWNFSAQARLPRGPVNNGFDGWNGKAEIIQQDDGIVISIDASLELRVYVLYSPSEEDSFFCFEPVSHPVDAHHGAGLKRLAPGETMQATMRVSWRNMSPHGDQVA
ncbi:MAG TPA: aldose 1-epimerase [Bauldia sp.]|nr:aldose 1-epimerase [Bauldia sp.]